MILEFGSNGQQCSKVQDEPEFRVEIFLQNYRPILKIFFVCYFWTFPNREKIISIS